MTARAFRPLPEGACCPCLCFSIEQKAGEASYSPDYEKTEDNITWYWLHLLTFAAAFSLLAVITLEFIDKDRR